MRIGFAECEISPPCGVHLAGYFSVRPSVDVLDHLYARGAVIESGGKKLAFASCDLLGIGQNYVDAIKNIIAENTDIKKDAILIHGTHTHTGPKAVDLANPEDKMISGDTDLEYIRYMTRKVASAVIMASRNLKEVEYGTGEGYEDRVAFIRRFKMKDGSIRTNPGVGNPDIVEPVGDIDPRVDLVDFKYTDGSGNLLFVSYSLHADIVGGDKISADYPGAVRRIIERAKPGCKVMYFTGAQGDINHINVKNTSVVQKGYGFMTRVGNILGGEVIKAYEDITYHKDCELASVVKKVTVPLRRFSNEDYEWAMKIIQSLKDGTFKQDSMVKTADIARALRIRNSFKGGDTMDLEVTVFRIGKTGIVGFPGEPFIGYKKKIVQNSPAKNTLVLALVNGSSGYLPVAEAYAEGGYEASNSPFTPELEGILTGAALEGLKHSVK
jgi:neutral ceramidase